MATDRYRFFRVEARELLDGLTRGVLELEKGAAVKEQVGLLLRLAHTLKGTSRVVKQLPMGDAAHGIEDLLQPYRGGDAAVPRERIDALLASIDSIAAMLAALDGNQAAVTASPAASRATPVAPEPEP